MIMFTPNQNLFDCVVNQKSNQYSYKSFQLNVEIQYLCLARKMTSFRQSEYSIVLRVKVEVSGNMFSVKRIFEQVYIIDPQNLYNFDIG